MNLFCVTLGVELSCESMRIYCPNCISPTICTFDIYCRYNKPGGGTDKNRMFTRVTDSDMVGNVATELINGFLLSLYENIALDFAPD